MREDDQLTQPRTLRVVRDYDDLHDGLRARAEELKLSRETIDVLTGLPDRYCSKILAPVPIKALGRVSLGPMLQAMGLMILLCEDTEMLERMSKRYTERDEKKAHASGKRASGRKANNYTINCDIAPIMNAKRTMKLSAEKRSAIARNAAMCRWADQVKKSEIVKPLRKKKK